MPLNCAIGIENCTRATARYLCSATRTLSSQSQRTITGASDTPSVVRPRFQTGVRYRPNEIFSIDVIFGHNITGENANWITVGLNVRFPAPKK